MVVFGLVEWDGFLSGLDFCTHCRDIFKVRLSFDIGVVIRRVDDNLIFEVVLLFSVGSFVYPHVLYGELYGIK